VSRSRTGWGRGITPGGLIVTATAALVTVMLVGTACWLYLHKQGELAKDPLLQGLAALGILVALQARNRPDPASTSSAEDAGT
jgi:chromate transport protein ChrA